jgi:hypothetical protein
MESAPAAISLVAHLHGVQSVSLRTDQRPGRIPPSLASGTNPAPMRKALSLQTFRRPLPPAGSAIQEPDKKNARAKKLKWLAKHGN